VTGSKPQLRREQHPGGGREARQPSAQPSRPKRRAGRPLSSARPRSSTHGHGSRRRGSDCASMRSTQPAMGGEHAEFDKHARPAPRGLRAETMPAGSREGASARAPEPHTAVAMPTRSTVTPKPAVSSAATPARRAPLERLEDPRRRAAARAAGRSRARSARPPTPVGIPQSRTGRRAAGTRAAIPIAPKATLSTPVTR